MDNLDAPTIRRLALVRSMLRMGVDQSRLPEPSCAISLLILHDATELLLGMCCEHLGAAPEKSRIQGFEGYFDLAKKARGGKELPLKLQMQRLNQARNGLKHHGVLPAKSEVERFAVLAGEFLEQATAEVFGAALSGVSMVSLIGDAETRTILESGAQALASGDPKEATHRAVDALHRATLAYRHLRDGPFGGHRFMSTWLPGPRSDHQMALQGALSSLATAAGELEDLVTAMSVGVDLVRLHKFQAIAPSAVRFVGGGAQYLWKGAREVSPTDAAFCLDFALDSILRLQEASSVLADTVANAPPLPQHPPQD